MGRSRHLMPSRARVVVVTMPAEIDVTNADRIGEELSAAIASGAGIVVADMTGTRFCNSSGISMLVLAHRQAAANGAELRLVVLSAAVLRASEAGADGLPAADIFQSGRGPDIRGRTGARVTGVRPGRVRPQPFLTEVVALPDRSRSLS